MNNPSGLTAPQAVLRGHLTISLPTFAIIILAFYPAWITFGSSWPTWLALLIGFTASWLWWSWRIPHWRRRALQQGVPADELQKLAVMTGLVWPKGWIFEKTGFKIKDE